MSITLTALMKQRYDTAANWTAQNPTLLAGEIGIESDTKKWKVGTGATAWTSLVYAIGGTYPIVNADIAAAAAIAYSKLATLTSGNIVLGSAANVATSTAVTGDVTISNTGVTAIAAGAIVNADINASAAIVDTKLATIATAGKVSNSATTAASANTASAIVARDASGNFTAGTITAALTGAASSNVLKAGDTMTGVLAVTAGTAALPGIAVSGDPNTGIYSPGADQLAISTGGTGRITVDASGNVNIDSNTLYVDAVNNRVGINTTGPSYLLDIQSTSATLRIRNTTAPTTGGTSSLLFEGINDFSGVSQSYINSIQAGNSGVTQLAFGTSQSADATATERLRIGSAGTLEIKAAASTAPFIANIGVSEVARIDSSGRLLVGPVTGNANGGILQLSSGITFPATAVAASDANTLDDYEEGTWTPVYVAQTGTLGTVTYANVQGDYTKIGRLVTVTGGFYCTAFAAGTGSGDLRISGLPFANIANVNAVSVGDSRLFTANNPTGGQVGVSVSYVLLFYRTTANGAINNLQVSDAATGSGALNLVYFTASYQTS